MSTAFYGDRRILFSVVMSVHYFFKYEADFIHIISHPLSHLLFAATCLQIHGNRELPSIGVSLRHPTGKLNFIGFKRTTVGGPVAIYSSNVERMRFEEMRTDFICQFFRWKLRMDATEFADSKTLALFCPIVQYVLHRMLTLKRYLASLYQ